MTGRNFSNRDVIAGDVFISSTRELYVYLGYYSGTANSYYYYGVTEGHLYMYINTLLFDKDMPTQDEIIHNILCRSRAGIDGNGSYLKGYKKLDALVGHCDLSSIAPRLQSIYGLHRLGDRKPSKRNQKKS